MQSKILYIPLFLTSLIGAMEVITTTTQIQNYLEDKAMSILEDCLYGYTPDELVRLGEMILGFDILVQRGQAQSRLIHVTGPRGSGKTTALQALAQAGNLPCVVSSGEYIAGSCPDAASQKSSNAPSWQTVLCMKKRIKKTFDQANKAVDDNHARNGVIIFNNWPHIYHWHKPSTLLIAGEIPQYVLEKLTESSTTGHELLCICEGYVPADAHDRSVFHQIISIPLPDQEDRMYILWNILERLGLTPGTILQQLTTLEADTDGLTPLQMYRALQQGMVQASLVNVRGIDIDTLHTALESFKEPETKDDAPVVLPPPDGMYS